ncbi:MAG: CHAT domain-containing protein [Proteobacteria bacterium]|nr:CHAT domain-containing protein [Pseudomonadota bacterium]
MGLAVVLGWLVLLAPAWAQFDAQTAALQEQVETLSRKARFAEALPLATQIVSLSEARLGRDNPDIASALVQVGDITRNLGRYAAAEEWYQRSLTIREKALGTTHLDVSGSLLSLAVLYRMNGRYRDGLPFAERGLAIREAALGPDDPRVAASLNALAELERYQGLNAAAEPLYRRSLAIREKALGQDHPDVGNSLNNLALLYSAEGRNADAEAYFKRAVSVLEKAAGPEHPDVANALTNLAAHYRRIGRYSDGEPLAKRAVAIREKVLGPDHPRLGASLNELGDIYRYQRRFTEAVTPLTRSLAIREKALGPDHSEVAGTLNNLALLYRAQRRHQESEAAFKRAIAITEKARGPDHFDVANSRVNLGWLYWEQGFFDAALEQSRLAVVGTARYMQANAALRVTSLNTEQRRFRGFFFQHIALAHRIGQGAVERRAELAAEALETAQVAQSSSAGQAVAGMAARFAAGGDALAGVIRERQDLAERWKQLDYQLIAASSRPADERDVAAEESLRSEHAAATQQLAVLDARIAREFPNYSELNNPRPTPAPELQRLLGVDEAMLAYLVGSDETWLWTIRRDRVDLHRLAVTAKALTEEITALRARLDPERNPELKPFDVDRAHTLHNMLLAPAAPQLAGVRHVFIVPDGALQSLPIGVLVTAKPQTTSDYRKVAWLARQYAVTTLPSVSSLRAIRLFADRARATLPFLGVGDPALEGNPGSTRGVKLAGLFRGAMADVDAVRKLPPLPDTADELRALARAQGAAADSLYLRERASEATLKGLKLDQYRVIAFATHGLVAGELRDLAEPALVLTPPGQASRDNDGLLTASEIAQLKLNADWVILSACNTAANDGTPGADGLSGLAKAFFYAGSRTLLVSHWPVASEAAVRLTTASFDALQRAPEIGRAEALRRAQMALLDDTSLPATFAHPMIWAPFVVVGEGGSGR